MGATYFAVRKRTFELSEPVGRDADAGSVDEIVQLVLRQGTKPKFCVSIYCG